MKSEEISEEGIFAAALLALFGTVGHALTADRTPPGVQVVWLVVFIAALLILSAAAVNFDFRRIIR